MNKTFSETYFNWSELDLATFIQAIKDTLLMTIVSMIFVLIFGLLLGLALYYLGKSKKKSAKVAYSLVSIISNIFRSTPFIILIILLIPFTKLLVGSFIGPEAAIPGLVLSAVPFYARLVEMAFREVDQGVLEASEAMGASNWQIIRKILIPESKPALISGLTVTAITMIGFTAMAGAIGAGGLGGLAYQDGFQRSRWTVTLVATVLILLLVFFVQALGDSAVLRSDKRLPQSAQKKRSKVKKIVWGVATLAVIGLAVWGSHSHSSSKSNEQATNGKDEVTLKVGASPTPHAEILEHIKPILKKKGINLEVVKFDDYILPNKALAGKEIDANYFQHIPYFKKQVKENNYAFTNMGSIHLEPMALYSQKIKDVKELKDGATIVTSNSESDWGRILTMLSDAGLITVKKGTKLETATFDDIEKNPKHLKFQHAIDASLLATAYQNNEGDLVAINANFAVGIGLVPKKDSVLIESDNSPYANIIAARTEDKNSKAIKELVKVLHSQEVQTWITKQFKGVVIPVNE